MITESTTTIHHQRVFNITTAMSPSITSIEWCGIRQQAVISHQEGMISHDTWAELERQNPFEVNVSVHTSSECFFDIQGMYPTTIVNSYFNIPLLKEENSSSVEKNDELSTERIKFLVENGRITEARDLLSTIVPGTSPHLNKWRNVLTQPRTIREKIATGGNIKDDCLWIKNNSIKHKGQWVALKRGVLLGSHVRRIELFRSLKQSGKLKGSTFFFIDVDE